MTSSTATAVPLMGSTDFTGFMLAQLRVAAARANLTVVEIDSIGTALAGGLIDAGTAAAWAADIGIDLTIASSVTITAIST